LPGIAGCGTEKYIDRRPVPPSLIST
jgi:hypothetical protein